MKTTTKTKKPTAKKPSKKEIIKQLGNPNLSSAEKEKLLDLLYEGVSIK